MERLTVSGVNIGFLDSSKLPSYESIYEKLRKYEDVEEQGLLVKLPCKVGDMVYTACPWGIESGVVGGIEIISDGIFVNNTYGGMIGESHNIFLTQDEAEEKLKGMKQ